MSLTKRCIVALAVAVSSWWLASWWLIDGAERFYAAVPLVALAFFLTGSARPMPGNAAEKDKPRENSWAVFRQGASMFAAVVMVGVCAMSLAFGAAVLQSWRFWFEIGAIIYLFGAVFIVLMALLRILLAGSNLLARRAPSRGKMLASAAALTIFIALAVPFAIAVSFVYPFKLPNMADPGRTLGRAYEEVEFTSADGTRLCGWWVPANPSASKRGSSRTILFCHGLAANRTQTLKFHALGDWLDANMFFFDMRGHGDSGGRTVSLGCREKADVLAAIAHVRQRWPDETRELVGMGLSLGAAVLAEAAGEVEPPLNGVILDSGFASTGDMTHRLPGPQFLHSWLLTLGLPIANFHAGCAITSFRPEASMSRLRAPVVIVHAGDDFVTPKEHSLRMYEQAAEPRQLLIFEGCGHCEAYFVDPGRYQQAIRKLEAQMSASMGLCLEHVTFGQ